MPFLEENKKIKMETNAESISWWDYGFKKLAKNPVRACSLRSTYKEMCRDLSLEDKFQRILPNGPGRGMLSFFVPILSASVFTALPHEYIHAGAATMLGHHVSNIVVNPIPFMSSFTQIQGPIGPLDSMAIAAAPYVLTAAGAYLVDKAKKKDSFFLYCLGSGALISHVGGILGDFYSVGRTAAYEVSNTICHTLGYSDLNQHNLAVTIPMAVGSFYLGAKAMSLTYRASKAAVNSTRSLFNKKR